MIEEVLCPHHSAPACLSLSSFLCWVSDMSVEAEQGCRCGGRSSIRWWEGTNKLSALHNSSALFLHIAFLSASVFMFNIFKYISYTEAAQFLISLCDKGDVDFLSALLLCVKNVYNITFMYNSETP